jgi:hypothetical protein
MVSLFSFQRLLNFYWRESEIPVATIVKFINYFFLPYSDGIW